MTDQAGIPLDAAIVLALKTAWFSGLELLKRLRSVQSVMKDTLNPGGSSSMHPIAVSPIVPERGSGSIPRENSSSTAAPVNYELVHSADDRGLAHCAGRPTTIS
jgi:hypothetical protein